MNNCEIKRFSYFLKDVCTYDKKMCRFVGHHNIIDKDDLRKIIDEVFHIGIGACGCPNYEEDDYNAGYTHATVEFREILMERIGL